MTTTDGQSVMPTQDEHSVTTTYEYTMEQIWNMILQSKEYNPIGRWMIIREMVSMTKYNTYNITTHENILYFHVIKDKNTLHNKIIIYIISQTKY